MAGKFVFYIILGAVTLASICLAAPTNIFSSLLSPFTKAVRIEPRVEVVHGPSYMVRGEAPRIVQGGPTQVFQGGPTHIIQGGPTHVVHGGPTHVIQGGPNQLVQAPPVVVGVSHIMQQPPPPPPPPVFIPGASHQCICTPPSNCRKTVGLHRCVQGKVNFNHIGAEVCCPMPDIIC